jgi:hypothetical protein
LTAMELGIRQAEPQSFLEMATARFRPTGR